MPFGLKSEPENDSFFTQQPSTPVTQQAPKQTDLPPIYPSRNNSAEETNEKIKSETSQCTSLEAETESHKDKTEVVQTTLDPSNINKTKKNEKHSLSDPVENKSDSPKEDSFIDISSIESNISFESEKSNFVEHESIEESKLTMGKAVPDFEEISPSNTGSTTEILKSSTEANISFEELESEVKVDNERESTPAYESSLLAVYVNTDSDNGESLLQMKGSDFEPVVSRDNNESSHQSFHSDQKNVGCSDLDLQNNKPIETGKQTLESSNDSLPKDENSEISTVNKDFKTVSGTDALPCDNSNLMDITCESLNSFHTVVRSQTANIKTNKSNVVDVVESCDITEFTQSASQAQVEPSSSLVSESVEDHYNKTLSEEGKSLRDNKKIFKGVCESSINNKQQELEEYSPLSPIVEVVEESSSKVDCYESKIDSSANTSSCSSETVIEKVSTMIENEGKQELEAASTESIMSSSSNSSYVKCLIEEAMEEARSEHSDSHSNSADRSESSKTESEHNSEKSVSGHDSGDEIDTTTSSDIEIISTPTPNGERGERLFDLSPLRITLHKSLRRHSPVHAHQRSDSQSSSSTYSKCGESDQLSPGRDSLERQDLESGDESKEAATPSVKEEPDNGE